MSEFSLEQSSVGRVCGLSCITCAQGRQISSVSLRRSIESFTSRFYLRRGGSQQLCVLGARDEANKIGVRFRCAAGFNFASHTQVLAIIEEQAAGRRSGLTK